MRVVKDTTERGINLFDTYSKNVTQDEEKKQIIVILTEITKKTVVLAIFSCKSS